MEVPTTGACLAAPRVYETSMRKFSLAFNTFSITITTYQMHVYLLFLSFCLIKYFKYHPPPMQQTKIYYFDIIFIRSRLIPNFLNTRVSLLCPSSS